MANDHVTLVLSLVHTCDGDGPPYLGAAIAKGYG